MTKQFGDNTKPYPSEMRVQLWPLCCGASIISGFKATAGMTVEAIREQIKETLAAVPDHQVYVGERITPKLTYLTLNQSQTQSKTIMDAVAAEGFKLFATASPRGSKQHFFVRDASGTFQLENAA